jgi:hypothetical protein
MNLDKILLFIIITIVIAALTDLLFTIVIGYLKLDVQTVLTPLLVEGSLGKTQQETITFIVPIIDLIVGVSGAAAILSWLGMFNGGGD